ncbi:MAG: ABC transporter permease [Acidobacteria bacterium]|nr:ABC transporter permease [Acidobacteriota bacterium]
MRKVLIIARTTFKENIRDKILYNLLFFTLAIIGVSVALGQVSIGHEQKIIIDMSLSAISLFGTLIAIFIGTGLVYKELDKRTIYNLISKPVRRSEFILGKYLGLMSTLLVNLALMSAGAYLALCLLGKSVQSEFLYVLAAVYAIFLQLMLVTAIALMFSTFSTPVLSAVFTFALWVIGHFSTEMKRLADILRSAVTGHICVALSYALPNFSNFTISGRENLLKSAAHFHAPQLTTLMLATAYGFLYSALLLTLAVFIFQKRDFK